MRFQNSRSIQAPLETVWARLSDFTGWERMIMQSGGLMRPRVILPEPGPGQAWDLEFTFRGKRREGELTVTEVAAPTMLCLLFTGTMLRAELRLTLSTEISGRTLLTSEIETKPLSIKGRLLLQTARLLRPRITSAINGRLKRLAQDIEYQS